MLAMRAHLGCPQECPAPEPIYLEASLDKEHRKRIHEFFKQPAFAALCTETVSPKSGRHQQPGGSIRLSYFPAKRQRIDSHPNSGRWPDDWPGGKSKFVRFVLYKENIETQAAVSILARYLHLHWSAFGLAGSKDKRGATVQHVTLFKIHPSRLASLNSKLRGLKVGDYKFVPQGLHLGELKGNRFQVFLRNAHATPADVAHAMRALKSSGFINYFGLQRFGNEDAPTHEIGCLLLKGEWQSAIRLIMRQRTSDNKSVTEARRLYLEKEDIAASNKLMPAYATAEKAILQALLKQGPASFLHAVLQVPRNLRSMYLHSFQSFLWNHAASFRAKKYGVDKVILGDLVLPPHVAAEDGGESSLDAQDLEPSSFIRLDKVHIITEADLADQTYTMEDVVLPLPGCKTIMPDNEVAQVYRQEAGTCGVLLEDCTHNVREFSITSLSGDYRKVIHCPSKLEWQCVAYSGSNDDIGYTDLDAINGKHHPDVDILDAGSNLPDGKMLGLKLNFQLPPSCYATMLLRELTKETTATTEHRRRTLGNQICKNEHASCPPTVSV